MKTLKQEILRYKIHLLILGSLIGYISWSFDDVRLTLFSVLIFFLYIKINTRIDLAIVVFSYLLTSSRGLFIGTITFYDNSFLSGLIIWLTAASITTIPYILFWSKKQNIRIKLLSVVILIQILPPFGFVSWVNPSANAGLIFPGMGFLSIFLFLILFYIIIFSNKYIKILLAAIIFFNLTINFPSSTTQNESIANNITSKIESNKNEIIKTFIINRLLFSLIPGLNIVVLTIILFIMLYMFKEHKYHLFLAISIIALLLANYNNPKIKLNIKQLETKYNYNPELYDFEKDFKRQNDLLKTVNASKENIIVAPESILGFYNDNSKVFIWDKINKVLFAGAYIKDKNNKELYDNVVVYLSPKTKKIVYKQRVPILVSMWRPWGNTGAKANIFKNPVVKIKDTKFSFFICYEQLLDFIVFHSAMNKPDIFIALSNLWWANGTTIENIQKTKLKLYSLQFNIPYVYSINR